MTCRFHSKETSFELGRSLHAGYEHRQLSRQRPFPAARQAYLEAETRPGIVISAITEAEIRFGLQKKPEAARLHQVSELFLSTISILPWSSQAAKTYGKLRAATHVAGINLSTMDMLIASHAAAIDATLVSHDRAFQRLTGFLTVVDWATDL